MVVERALLFDISKDYGKGVEREQVFEMCFPFGS